MPQQIRRDDIIQIRASAELKAMLHRAAQLRGQKLSEFMLESARLQAEEVILDQCVFFPDAKAHEAFLVRLDASAKPNAALRALLVRKPAWQR